MTGNPFVGTARIAWMEIRTHLRSPRLIVLGILFALAVLGASYGLSQPQLSAFQNQAQIFAHPAIVGQGGTTQYRAIAFLADIYGTPAPGRSIFLYSVDFSGDPTNETFLDSATTNVSGFVSFDLGTSVPSNVGYEFRVNDQPSGNLLFFDPNLDRHAFTYTFGHAGFSSPTGSADIAYGHILALDGTPATTADVYLNDTLLGHPDANGYFRVDVPSGDHTVRVVFGGEEQDFPVTGFQMSGPTFASGSDAVLLFLAVALMPLLLPIVAIAVSFDAIARERVQGSLELLLCRRVRREGILLGKFLGAFASIALPVVGVLLAGLGVVTLASGRAPSFGLGTAFLLAGLFLVAVYVLLMLIFSTLAKSVGTAVVFGVVVWIVFNVLFSFLAFFVLFASGGNPTSRGFYETLSVLFLLDPNTLYQMLLTLALPSTGGGSFGLIPAGYLGAGSVIAAGVLWIVALLIVATFLFVRRSDA